MGALLVLWNGVSPGHEDDYERWHEHEHVPERLTVPGMRWAQRWVVDAARPPEWFTVYAMDAPSVLASPSYRALLAAPTRASAHMRPLLTRVDRWVCVIDRDPLRPLNVSLVELRYGRRTDVVPIGEAACALVARRVPAEPLGWLVPGQAAPRAGDGLCLEPSHELEDEPADGRASPHGARLRLRLLSTRGVPIGR